MIAKRILIVFEGSFYPKAAVDFAIKVTRDSGGLLTGVFLEHTEYAYVPSGFGVEPQPFDYSYEAVNEAIKIDEHDLDRSRKLFYHQCGTEGINFSTLGEDFVNSNELLEESRYADIVITGYKFLEGDKDGSDRNILGNMMEDFECPVILIPEGKPAIEQVIFVHDGKDSSTTSIRLFNYLFYNSLKGVEYHALVRDGDTENKAINPLKIYLDLHLKGVNYIYYSNKEEDAIQNFLNRNKKPALLVLGIAHRGFLSRLFSAGEIEGFLQTVPSAFFINPE